MLTGEAGTIEARNPKLVEMFNAVVEGLVQNAGADSNLYAEDTPRIEDAEFQQGSYSIGYGILGMKPLQAAAVGAAMQEIASKAGLKFQTCNAFYHAGLQGRTSDMVERGLRQLGRNLDELNLPEAALERAKSAFAESMRPHGFSRGM